MTRILLVDDDDDVRTLLEHVLLAERYEVDAAATVEATRALLERNHYHLLVTDMALPDGTGLQIAEEVSRRGTPAIILTAYAFRYPQAALARFDVMLKPVRPAELLDAVAKVLNL